MLLNKSEYKEKLGQLLDKKKTIDERVALIADSLNAIDPVPSLSEILLNISTDDDIMRKAYKNLCEDIRAEVFVLLNQINDRKTESAKIDADLLAKEKESNRYCSIYAKVPPLQDLKDGSEYDYFLKKYEQGVRLSQEISELNLKVVKFLDIQRVLDDAFAGSMIEVDYLLSRLNDAVKMFKYFKTFDLIQNYKSKYCAYKDLQKMVDDKNEEFEAVLKKINNPRHTVVRNKPQK